jgi:hypothetical protein
MNIKTILIIILLLGNSTLATANSKSTWGSPDCAQWFKKDLHKKTWLLGFLTGMNMHKRIDYLDKLNSAEQAYLWMDNYCQKNPLSGVAQGGEALYIELMNEK